MARPPTPADVPAPNGSAARAPEPCSQTADPRRWRNAPLAQRLFIIHNLMMRIGDRLVGDLGLTSSRWLMLGAIEQFAEAPTLSELSSNALISVQNVSRMVASMEADGLVERFTVSGRGRATFVRTTDHGRAVHSQAENAARRFTESFLAGLSEGEVDRAERLLERLVNNLEGLETALDHETRAPAPAKEGGTR